MSEQQPEQKQGEPGEERERRRRNPMAGLFWGLLLILLGVLFFAQYQGWLPGDKWWQYFLVGLGVILLIESGVRRSNPDLRSTAFSRLIAGLVLAFIGLAFLFGVTQWWPIVLIAAGVAILVGYWRRRM